MRKSILLAAPLAFAIATGAVAQSPQPEKGTTTEPAATQDPDQKVKCRRVEVTGSLVRKERVCKTVAEWRAIQESGNQNARDIVDHSRTRPAGGT